MWRGTGYIWGKKNAGVRNIETVFVCLGILCFGFCGAICFGFVFWGFGRGAFGLLKKNYRIFVYKSLIFCPTVLF